MRRRDQFVAQSRDRWRDLELQLRGGSDGTAEYWQSLAANYRALCADLARAQSMELGADVLHYLDSLAARAHNRLYRRRRSSGNNLLRVIASDFPFTLRREWVFFLVANLLFYGPFFAGVIGALISPDFAASVLPPSALESMEAMYGDSISRGSVGEDATMVGFYVRNNVGIAFQCFATGALAGIGSAYFLIYNGLILGTVEGHLWSVGLGMNLTEFTAGHTPWELTGIVVAGTAGLRMGWSLVVTRGQSRAQSLREAGPTIFRLILGAAVMLFVAAGIEGLWSASPIPFLMKMVFGVLGIVVVVVWLGFGGRRSQR